MNGLEWLSALLLAWTSVAMVFATVAVARAPRRGSAPKTSCPARRRVLVVRACAGEEPQLERSLASVALARRSFELSVRLSVANVDDRALPVARRVAEALRREGLDARACVVPPFGPNHKVAQLAGLVEPFADRVDAVVVADSDIDLEGLDLDTLVAHLFAGDRPVGAVWCPPVEHGPTRTWGDRFSAAVLNGSLHAFALLGSLDRGALVGKTFAVRADALRQVGGFGTLVRHLGEDMELARRFRVRGWTVEQSPQVVGSLATGRSLPEVFDRYVRWLLVIRAQRRHLLLSYPLLLVATPLVLASGLALLPHAPGPAAVALVLVTTQRLLVARAAARLAGGHGGWRRACLDAVLADGLLLAAWVRALGPRRVRWRQRTLSVGARGLLEDQSTGDVVESAGQPRAEV